MTSRAHGEVPPSPLHRDRDVAYQAVQRVVPAETTRYGLVIGINQYADVRLNLRCAVADARALRDLMVDPECGCFPAENVQLLIDHEATTERVFRALANLRRRATENDTVWIYYAGHAAVETQAYWVTHDADVDDLFATALGSERINSVVAQLRTRRVLYLLDCCHAATAALRKHPTRQLTPSSELLARFEGHGVITLAASSGMERSVELPEVGHGAFTYFLARGLRGEADSDMDGVVTADELWAYLRGKVAAVSGRTGNAQTPMLIGSMTHDLALTLNAVSTARKRRLMKEIEGLVGLRNDQLSTDEGRLCADIVLHGARSDNERLLLEALEELGELGDRKLTSVQFRLLLQVAKFTLQARDAQPPGSTAIDTETGIPEIDADATADLETRATLPVLQALSAVEPADDPGVGEPAGHSDSTVPRKTLPLPIQDPTDWIPGGEAPPARPEPEPASVPVDAATALHASALPRYESWRIAYLAVVACGIAIAGANGLTGTAATDMAAELTGAAASSRATCDRGDLQGCMNLATAYDAGQGAPRDATKAVALYRKVCEGDRPSGCTKLGVAYDTGRGVASDVAAAATLYQKACDGGDMRGCNLLGAAYSKARGTARDLGKAVTLFRRACNEGHMPGCASLALAYERGRGIARDASRAVTLYQQACDGGDMNACIDLGIAYDHGRGVLRDTARATSLYRQATQGLQHGCDQHEPRDCATLGMAYADGLGLARDPTKAAMLCRQACDGGDMRGCHCLGIAHEKGAGVARDEEKAAALFRQACGGGDMPSCGKVGATHASGRGVERNPIGAAALYMAACEGGDPRSCASLGIAFELGDGITRDANKAAILYQQACDAWDATGCGLLGLAYENGSGVTRDLARAALFYERACDGDRLRACERLALAYQNGVGVARDPAKAVAIYMRACDADDMASCRDLAAAYTSGSGVERDPSQGARLYQKACDGGEMLACNNLGMAYETGRGVPRDPAKAAALFREACDGKIADACARAGSTK